MLLIDLPRVVLRILESSRETNRLPYPIEGAIRRRKFTRLVAMWHAFPWLSWITAHTNPRWTGICLIAVDGREPSGMRLLSQKNRVAGAVPLKMSESQGSVF